MQSISELMLALDKALKLDPTDACDRHVRAKLDGLMREIMIRYPGRKIVIDDSIGEEKEMPVRLKLTKN